MRPEELEEAARLLREGKATPEGVARTLMAGSREVFERTVMRGGAPAVGEPAAASFGKYEILGEIARGGMGVVYRARERALNRTVALKVLLAGEGATAEQIQRFIGEARAAAALQHPGIVQIYDVGEEKGVHYFAMELVEGLALDQLLKRDGPPEPAQALRIIRDVARALDFAHGKGIVHRDIKPGNILLSSAAVSSSAIRSSGTSGGDMRVLLSDFGLAKDLSTASSLTISGNLLGTPAYMSPEQAAGRTSEIDARSDVFSLGAVAYHTLTGEIPFGGATIADVLQNIRGSDPRPMRSLRAGLHRDVEITVGKALAREKERRYRSAGELADDIDRYLRGEAILAAPPSFLYRASRFVARRRAAVAAAAVCLAAVAATAGWSAWRSVSSTRERLSAARARIGEALIAARSGRFEDAYVSLGLGDALVAGLPESAAARTEIRYLNAASQVESYGSKGNWDSAAAALEAFADVRGHPGYASLARTVAGTATLEVTSAEAPVDVDIGACVPGVLWDEETFPSMVAARTSGICSPAGTTPIRNRDVPFGDCMVVLSRDGAAVRVIGLRLGRLETLRLEQRVTVFRASSEPATMDLSGIVAGHTLEFGTGTWVLPKLKIPGLMIRAAKGESPVFVPPGESRDAAIQASAAHGLALRDVAIEGRQVKGLGVHAVDTLRPSIARARLRDIGGAGIRFDRSPDWLVRATDVNRSSHIAFIAKDSPRGLALRAEGRDAGWTIFDFDSPGCRALLCRAERGERCGFHAVADDVKFEACEAHDCPEMGLSVEVGARIVVEDCLARNCGTTQKIGTSGGLIVSNVRTASATHNTVVGGAVFGLYVNQGSGVFEDNLVAGVRPGMAFRWFCWGGSIQHALAWDCGAFAGIVQNRCVTLDDVRRGQEARTIEFDKVFRKALEADPKFLDATNGDYRLAEDSPARGAASDGGDLGVRWSKVAELRARDDRSLVFRENASRLAARVRQTAKTAPDEARAELTLAQRLDAGAPGVAEAESSFSPD
jgi:hypothetical protein